jgi:hypothetical protein
MTAHARYALSGPEDVTGKRMDELAEQYPGVKVRKADCTDSSSLSDLATAGVYLGKVLP